LGPDGISIYPLVEHLDLIIWHGGEEEAPVLTHACRAGNISLWMKRLLTTIVRGIARHHRFQVMAISCPDHALEHDSRCRRGCKLFLIWCHWDSSLSCRSHCRVSHHPDLLRHGATHDFLQRR